MDFDRWLSDLQTRVADTQRKSAELMDNLGSTSATASSPDGAVTVVVGANGALHKIDFSPRIAEHTSAQLSALVMKAVHKAQRDVAERVGEALQPFDANGELLERYVSYQPPADEDELAEEGVDPASINAEFGMPATPAAPPTLPPPPPPAAPAPAQFHPPQPAAPARPRPRPVVEDDDEGEDRPW
ncbi:MAG TPA: YbaB/EbfC family nucleoid-associated protein [Pseudonocardiaceae bacterium]|jgi:DNA-binding protein YbaB|nr:YbaB/EbfC family nucleoid-associated protein [Pseudonocardiaceae bacterium]